MEDPKHTVFDSQSANQIIAEIDFGVNSESRLSTLTEEEVSNDLRANPAQFFKIPESVSAAERKFTH